MFNIIELILDEQEESIGIEAISVVENPAIEEDFVALNSELVELKELNKDKQILLGCLLYTSPSPRDGLLSRMPSSA